MRGGILQEAVGDLFHAPGEARVMALVVAMGPTGLSNIDLNRAKRETLPNYRELTYYEIWLTALEQLVKQRGILNSGSVPQNVMHAATVAKFIARGSPVARSVNLPARFSVGQSVRTVAQAAPHHTRLPGYARGKLGLITRVHGAHVFPDTHAQGLGESPQWLYNVAFEAQELWGEAAAAPQSSICIDAFEPYLQAA